MKAIKSLWKNFAQVPQTYAELCQVYLPRPLHDKIELEQATEVIDFLAGHSLNADQEDYLDLISDLVADFEEEHHPLKIRRLKGVSALKFLLQENNLKAADLSRILGADRTLGAKILRGERNLTLDHVKKLAHSFAVETSLFLD